MRRVSLDDLTGLARYAAVRDELRRRTIELKRERRVAVGDRITLVFENFDTVLFQIQEMLHVERITDIDKIRDECDVYNALLPGPHELSATLFVEITEAGRIREDLDSLVGIDEHVSLVIDGERVRAVFEAGRSEPDRISAVQYIRFQLGPDLARALGRKGLRVAIEIDHPRYRETAMLGEGQRASLAADLEA